MLIYRENLKLHYPAKNRFFYLNFFYQSFTIIFTLAIWLGEYQAGRGNQFSLIYLIPLFISMFMHGMMTAAIQLEVLMKPFSSCLPDHNKIPARVILLMGIIASLFYGVFFFLLHRPAGLKGILYFITITAIGLSIYLLTVFWTFYIQNKRHKGIFILCCIILLLVFDSIWLQFIPYKFSFDYFIFYSSMPLVFFAILLMFVLWKMLAQPDLKRIFFSGNYPMFNIHDNHKIPILLNEALLMSSLSERAENESLIERLFLRLMRRFPFLNIKRSIAGKIYCTLDHYYTLNKGFFKISLSVQIIVATLLLFFTGYHLTPGNFGGVPASDITQILFLIILCITVFSMFSPISHNQLLPTGRSDQFWTNISVLVTQSMIVIAWTFIIIFLSWITDNYIPDIKPAGFYFKYHPLELSLILWPLAIVPALNSFWYCFDNLPGAIMMILLIAILITMSIFSLLTAHIEYRIILTGLSILMANGFFIHRLTRYWLRKDIIRFI